MGKQTDGVPEHVPQPKAKPKLTGAAQALFLRAPQEL